MDESDWTDLIRSRKPDTPVRPPADAAPRLEQLPGIRAVVFDVYGTLFSSGVGDIGLATGQNRNDQVKAALEEAGFEVATGPETPALDTALHTTVKAHQAARQAAGIGHPEVNIHLVWRDLVEQLTEDGVLAGGGGADLARLAIDYETRVNPVQPMPGLESVLARLRSEPGVLGIISNAQFFTPLLFDAFLGKGPVALGFAEDCCIWSYELLEAKPSTRLYTRCGEELEAGFGIAPGETLYVGNDMRNDIVPARACGFRTALFAGDRLSLRRRGDDPGCAGIESDLEVTDLKQILECIG